MKLKKNSIKKIIKNKQPLIKKIRIKLKIKIKLNKTFIFWQGKKRKKNKNKKSTIAQPPCHYAHAWHQWKKGGVWEGVTPHVPSKRRECHSLTGTWYTCTNKSFFNNIYINKKTKSSLSTCLLQKKKQFAKKKKAPWFKFNSFCL